MEEAFRVAFVCKRFAQTSSFRKPRARSLEAARGLREFNYNPNSNSFSFINGWTIFRYFRCALYYFSEIRIPENIVICIIDRSLWPNVLSVHQKMCLLWTHQFEKY